MRERGLVKGGPTMRRRAARLVWSFVVTVAAVAAIAPRAKAAESVQLQATAVKQELLVGEPLMLVVTVKTTAAIQLDTDLLWPESPLRVLIDRGSGFTRYLAKNWVSGTRENEKGRLGDGQITQEHVLGFDARLGDWPFPAPGTYRLVVEYQDDAIGPFRSNVVALTVRAPTGDEKAVHDELRGIGPDVLGLHLAGRLAPAIADLARRFPSSVYLQEQRLNDLDARHSAIASGYDPDDARPSTDPSTRPDLTPETVRVRQSDLLPLANEIADVPGQFQPNALLVLAGLYAGAGDHQTARQTYERIVRDFPNREAARLALEEVGDTTPPMLELTASPSTLWPPNHELVSVTVTVDVTDDADPSPTVKLLSVTCDDACNPSHDIVGATLNADDRLFQLRATRKGGGSGRTYLITYSAKDAAGNTTSKTTVVRVPHDQGK